MNPELLEYARSLGIFMEEVKKAPAVKKRRGPGAGEGGRPRKECGHTEPRRVRPDGRTYCRSCETARQVEAYHRKNPNARRYNKEKAA